MILNIIQEAPTPHNNTLLKAIKKKSGVELLTWYDRITFTGHGFTNDLAYEVQEPLIYKRFSLDRKLLSRFLFSREIFLMVGWTSPTTRAIVIFSFLLRKPLNMWFDMPNDIAARSFINNKFRNFFYFLVRFSPVKIFCVGNSTVNYFANRGFSRSKLVNLPIFIDIENDKTFYTATSGELKKELGIDKSAFIISGGSRLLHEKGYDLLVEAVNLLSPEIKEKLQVFIIGKGEEEENLKQRIEKYGLQNCIRLLPWLPTHSFMSLIALSDIFIHPARFDAFGGTIFSMSVGTPVIGSKTAGAAFDRIEHGKNGFLYEAEDVHALADHINWAYNNQSLLPGMGNKARETALQWTPEQGAEIILANII